LHLILKGQSAYTEFSSALADNKTRLSGGFLRFWGLRRASGQPAEKTDSCREPLTDIALFERIPPNVLNSEAGAPQEGAKAESW
jgi:hypothetical protein